MPSNVLKVVRNNGVISASVFDDASVEHDITSAFQSLISAPVPAGVGGELVCAINGTTVSVILNPSIVEMDYTLPKATVDSILDITGA